MSYPLRLPTELDSEARERCAALGISLNALISVALDAYLRAERPKSKQRAAKLPAGVKPSIKPVTVRNPIEYHPDPQNWRNFHAPDSWPVVDPEWESGLDEPESWDVDSPEWKSYFAELESLYWSAHERPKS